MQEYKYYVAGEFKESKQKINVINPATEEVFANIFETTKEDLNIALGEAKSAQAQWRATSYLERAKVLREISRVIFDNLSVLAELESKEIGKPLKESLFVDIPLGGECFNYYASFLESLEDEAIRGEYGLSTISYEPFGVCGVYLPFNTPLMIFGFSCAAALAAGNALIVKLSEYGSLSMLELAKYLDSLDIPKGLINIISGRGQSIGKEIAQSNIDLISFTGSRDTLKKVISTSAQNPKKIICELGGCNLTIVFSDADKEAALQNVLGSSFMKQGQMCIGTSVVLVQEDMYENFVKELVFKTNAIKVGDPFDSLSGIGALVTKDHIHNIDNKVKAVLSKGGRLLAGGEILKHKGYFYPPTIIEVDEISYDEFFAPVILIKKFKNTDQIKKILEDNPTGLVTQIWTKDLEKADSLAKLAKSGTVWINTFACMSAQTPFGGMGQSGWGRNLGKLGFFEYAQAKHIGLGIKKSPVDGWFGV